jgi:hypothetical protein
MAFKHFAGEFVNQLNSPANSHIAFCRGVIFIDFKPTNSPNFDNHEELSLAEAGFSFGGHNPKD